MSKKPKPPATLDLPHIMAQLGMAKHWIQQTALSPAQQAVARIEDAERAIQKYAIAIAPVATEETGGEVSPTGGTEQ